MLTIDAGKNIIAGSGSTLDIKGAIKLGSSTGGANQVIAITQDGGLPRWTDAVKLTAGDLSCTDCIDAAEIKDVYVLNTGDALAGDLTLNARADLRFADSDSSNYVGFEAPAAISNDVIWTLPSADGSASQYLQTNGTGALTWATVSNSSFSLSGLSDTTVTSPAAGHLLIYDGTDTWDNQALSGDATISSAGALTIAANAVALSTDTTGNYVATIADAGNSTITVAGSGAEGAAVTLDAIDLNCTDCLNDTEIEDIYLLNSGDTATGNLTITKADPAMVFDVTTATDTDFWLGVNDDAGADDDDLLQIGDGTTVGTNPFVTINTTGNVGIGTTAPAAKLHLDSASNESVGLIIEAGSTDGQDAYVLFRDGAAAGQYIIELLRNVSLPRYPKTNL